VAEEEEEEAFFSDFSELDPESDFELAESPDEDEPLEPAELSDDEPEPFEDPAETVLDPLRLSVR
jgi:hypothetical protein